MKHKFWRKEELFNGKNKEKKRCLEIEGNLLLRIMQWILVFSPFQHLFDFGISFFHFSGAILSYSLFASTTKFRQKKKRLSEICVFLFLALLCFDQKTTTATTHAQWIEYMIDAWITGMGQNWKRISCVLVSASHVVQCAQHTDLAKTLIPNRIYIHITNGVKMKKKISNFRTKKAFAIFSPLLLSFSLVHSFRWCLGLLHLRLVYTQFSHFHAEISWNLSWWSIQEHNSY